MSNIDDSNQFLVWNEILELQCNLDNANQELLKYKTALEKISEDKDILSLGKAQEIARKALWNVERQ